MDTQESTADRPSGMLSKKRLDGGVGGVVVSTNHAERRVVSYAAILFYPITKLRLFLNYVTVLGRLVIPVFLAAYSAWLRNQRSVVDGLRRQLVPGVLAVVASSVSLSTLARAIAIPCGKIDPLLRTIRVIKPRLPTKGSEGGPEKSVKCDVLYDPGSGGVTADVIFIHGLHGSLEKTWRQGLWNQAHGTVVPLDRNNSCYSISPRGNPAMVSLRKQTTFVHTDTTLHAILNPPPHSKASKDVKEDRLQQQDSQIGGQDFTASDIDVCREAMSSKVDDIMNGGEREGEEDEQPTNQESYSPCWPRDWLPVDCPGVRVIALNYSTDPFLWRPLWVTKRIRTAMLERGREMMELLQQLGVGNNPIVWVGHSKGGLFVKQVIVDAYESGNAMWAGICHNTRGIMFYSVPHRGSPCADISLPLLRKSIEVTEVQKDCSQVLELHDKFLALIDSNVLQAEIFSFIETVQTFMSIMYMQIVTLETADPGIGRISAVSVDHRNICKPRSRQCTLYRELINLIQQNI